MTRHWLLSILFNYGNEADAKASAFIIKNQKKQTKEKRNKIMRKKGLVRMLALATSAAMLTLSLTACGGGTSASGDASGSGDGEIPLR